MERPISKTTIFVDGAARFKDLIYLIAKDRGLVDEDVEHSRFIAFDQLKFAHMGDRNWNAVAVCVAETPAKKMVAVGEDGQVATYTGGKLSDEQITPQPSVLRGIGVIEGHPFVCGMKRQVYKRVGENSWAAMHAPAPAQGVNAGFEAIDGYSTEEIYAVGWKGEVWEWNGSDWLHQASPTNLILTGVCCAGDDNVYVCGQHGTVLRGRHDHWEVIDLGELREDFWDLHWFNGQLFLASMSRLYTLTEAGVIPVDFGADVPATCYRLTDTEGVLWSVGASDVFSFDGTHWTRID